MLAKDFKSVDEYIAAQPEAMQAALERVRETILSAVPEAREQISYNMPTYTLNGKRLLYFAAWKRHFALYGASEPLVATFGDELAPYDVAKGTIRFPLSAPVPVRLIERIAVFRAEEAIRRDQDKPAAPNKKRILRH